MPGVNGIGQALIVSGLPGAGKDTHVRRILAFGSHKKLVTYATRAKRDDEVEGEDYFFVSLNEFNRLKAEGEIVEQDPTGTTLKGTSLSQLKRLLAGEDLVWRITPNRAAFAEEFFIKQFGPLVGQEIINNMVKVFISVSDPETLLQRYIAREKNPKLVEFQTRLVDDLEVFNANRDRFPHIIANEGPIEPTTELILELAREKLEVGRAGERRRG